MKRSRGSWKPRRACQGAREVELPEMTSCKGGKGEKGKDEGKQKRDERWSC